MNPFPLEPLATAAGVTLGQIGGQPRRSDGDPATGYAELGALNAAGIAAARAAIRSTT